MEKVRQFVVSWKKEELCSAFLCRVENYGNATGEHEAILISDKVGAVGVG